MKILVLGGTQFVGRHIVENFVACGHRITTFSRGRTPGALSPAVVQLRGDRDQGRAGLAALVGRCWDACVDVSGYWPRQVRASCEALSGRVGHYVFISAVSVYGDPARGPVDESYPRLPAAADSVTQIDNATYGPLKAACEGIVEAHFGGGTAILRPQVVAGPYDPLDRFSYWVRRAGQGGRMLAPGGGSDFVQVIDAHDVAQFTRLVCECGLTGTYNLAGPRITWAEFVVALGEPKVTWVAINVLRQAGVTELELPLFRATGEPRSSLMHVCHDRAVRAGLKLTSPAETISRVRAWLPQSNLVPALTAERETALLRLAEATSNR